MKRWNVVISEEAQGDLAHIHDYIADSLCEPGIALNQINRIRKAIFSLHEMPERFPVYTRGFHRMNVDNYAAFYQISHQTGMVSVVAVIYGGRDIDKILETDFTE